MLNSIVNQYIYLQAVSERNKNQNLQLFLIEKFWIK